MSRLYSCQVFFLFFLSFSVFAEKINFITLDVEPWASYDESKGEFVGVFPDVVREIEIRTGYEINISLSPFAFERINRELDMGRQDCKVFLLDGAKDSIIVVGSSIFDIPMGVVAKKELSLVDRLSLKGVKISTLKPLSESGKFMDDDFFDRVFDADYSVGLKKLAHGRVDAVAGAIPTIMFLAKSEGMESDVGIPLLLSYEKIFFQCSKSSRKINAVKNISKIVEKMRAEGVLGGIASENSW